MTLFHVSENPGIQLRPANDDDLAFLDELRRTTLTTIVTNHHEWDDAKQRARVRAQFASAKIIMLDDEPVGLWKVYRDGGCLHLNQVQVLPAHQGKGIGTQLISRLKHEAQQQGLPITLHVYRSNPAIRLYQRHNFQVTAETVDMFTMTWRPTRLTVAPMSSDPNSFWSEFVATWNTHEAEHVSAHFADNARFEFYDGTILLGRDAIASFYRNVFANMPDNWVHSNPITEGTGTLTAGTFVIRHNQNSIIMLRYELLLDADGLIQNLTLMKT